MKQKMLLIQEQAVMTDFCYAYCQALLDKAKQLVAEDRVLRKSEHGSKLYVTDIALAVFQGLSQQLGQTLPVDHFYGMQMAGREAILGSIEYAIATAEEFLAIFEVEEEG